MESHIHSHTSGTSVVVVLEVVVDVVVVVEVVVVDVVEVVVVDVTEPQGVTAVSQGSVPSYGGMLQGHDESQSLLIWDHAPPPDHCHLQVELHGSGVVVVVVVLVV